MYQFEAVLQAEGPGTFLEVPLDVPAAFGRARAPVRGTLNGTPFRSTVAVYGGRYYLPVNRALRQRAGLPVGDAVTVELQPDDEPRRAAVPADLRAALDAEAGAAAGFEALSYTHQREYVEWVTEAKRGPTRARRIQEVLRRVRDG